MKLPAHQKTKVRTSRRFLLPFLFLVQTLFALQSPPTLIYSDSTSRIETSPYAAVLEDAKAEFTIEQVMAMPDSSFHWKKSTSLHLGDCASRFWVRFAITNKTKEDLFFQNTFSLFHYLDMYVVSEDGSLKTYPPSGSMRPFENRALSVHTINFNLGKTPKLLYMAVQSSQGMVCSNGIGSKDAVYDFVRRDERIFFFCFGLYLILAVYNLAIYFNSRDTPFLYYALYQLGIILYYLHYSGLGYEYVWRSFPFINGDSNFHVAAPCFGAYFFSITFLNTRNIIPRFHRYLQIIMVGYAGALLLQLVGFVHISNAFCYLFIIILYFSLWAAGWSVYFKQYQTARFYLVGWTIYIFAVITTALYSANLVPALFSLVAEDYIMQIGTTCEAIFLAFALADRVREIRQQARDAQQLLLKQSQEYEELVEKHNHLLEVTPSVKNDTNDAANRLEALMLSLRAERDTIRKISIPTMEGIILLPMSDLVRIEALGSYAVFYLSSGKKITASRPIGDFEAALPDALFFRTHKSHIVNLNCVERYIRGEGGSVVLQDGSEIGVSRTAKAELLSRLHIV